jgi:DNA polymerase-3 subunit delta'
MTAGVWANVVGQPAAVEVLSAAGEAAADLVAGRPAARGAMTHAWLFTGPPGSGRSVAARAFAAALQCTAETAPRTAPGEPVDGQPTDGAARVPPGCGECPGCRTALAGTHADVRLVVPEGLSISVAEMRSLVQAAARRPTSGHWQVVLIEDADRLTEGAANALLKAVEEPPERTVFLLCAPSDHPEDVAVTIRSRCRVVALRTPSPPAIADVLQRRDGIDAETARWAASVCGGHVGRARRLASDPAARERRAAVLRVPLALRRLPDVFTCADELVRAAEEEASTVNDARNEAEREALETAMGGGGTGKGTQAASRGAKGALRELERRQKSRSTRTQVSASGARVPLNHPDMAEDSARAAAAWTPVSTLRRLEAVLACREAIELNVKPRVAIEAMVTTLHTG